MAERADTPEKEDIGKFHCEACKKLYEEAQAKELNHMCCGERLNMIESAVFSEPSPLGP
jgi:hypothetical protein